MKHEIIVSIYDSGYGFSIMVDRCNNDDPNVIRKCPDSLFDCEFDGFISYLAELYDWNTGDVVSIIWCEDGGIEICTKTVKG